MRSPSERRTGGVKATRLFYILYEKRTYLMLVTNLKLIYMKNILKGLIIVLVAYIYSWLLDLACISLFAFFSRPNDGLISTIIFFVVLGLAGPLLIVIGLFVSRYFVKLIDGKWYLAITPILIYVWHGINDILTFATTNSVSGDSPNALYYVRVVGMSIYIIIQYIILSGFIATTKKNEIE